MEISPWKLVPSDIQSQLRYKSENSAVVLPKRRTLSTTRAPSLKVRHIRTLPKLNDRAELKLPNFKLQLQQSHKSPEPNKKIKFLQRNQISEPKSQSSSIFTKTISRPVIPVSKLPTVDFQNYIKRVDQSKQKDSKTNRRNLTQKKLYQILFNLP